MSILERLETTGCPYEEASAIVGVILVDSSLDELHP
jgi:hypothetical protein